MTSKDVTVSILGDCVTNGVCSIFNHTTAFGLTNWLSISSPSSPNFKRLTYEAMKTVSLPTTNYSKRICYYNSQKNILDFLLSKKADFFIVDLNDCRKGIIIDKTYDSFACITNNSFMKPFKGYMDIMFPESKGYEVQYPLDIKIDDFYNAINFVSQRILEKYNPSQIILMRHYPVYEYADRNNNSGIHEFLGRDASNNENGPKVFDLVKQLENYFLSIIGSDCHIINFPDNVLADPNHVFGRHSLHYHAECIDYYRECLSAIFDEVPNESLVLEQLRQKCSNNFALMRQSLTFDYYQSYYSRSLSNLFSIVSRLSPAEKFDLPEIKSLLKKQNIIFAYFDLLQLFSRSLTIMVSLNGSNGFYKDVSPVKILRSIGFASMSDKWYFSYVGCLHKGIPLIDCVAKSSAKSAESDTTLGESVSVHLTSKSKMSGNFSSILIDGVEYSINRRGINIVVCGYASNKLEVIDSISFNSYLADVFVRQ